MIKSFQDLTGGLNLTQSNNIKDNELVIATNVFYNNAKQLQTRRGYKKFGNAIGSSPATSYFFYQRDDNLDRIAVCHAGGSFYTYNESTGDRDSVYANYIEYETKTGSTSKRTRRDYCVYKNTIYMCDGVNPYASYDGTTHSLIGISAGDTVTADSSTDRITKAAHGHTAGDEVYITSSGDMPGGLNAYQVYYVIDPSGSTFQLSTDKNGTAIDITSNGTGTLTMYDLSEPRCRYIQYLGDSLYGAGDDANPSTLYYTDAAPADGTNINQNLVVVGGDEAGVINGLNEYTQIVIVFKDQKSYAVNVATPSVETIDSQTGGYADRCTYSVGNTLLYFNERGIDSLIKRSGVGGVSAIESKPLSDNVRKLVSKIEEDYYNSSAALYIKKLNNYYFSFDTNADDRPDTTLVYNALVGSWTQYNYPNIYDYGFYVNSDKEWKFLFSSASGGQFYEMESGFDDDGQEIEVQVKSKDLDFNDPAQVKTFDFVDLVGYKQQGGDITANIYVDGAVEAGAMITDSNITLNESLALGISSIGIDALGQSEGDIGSDLLLYPFTVRVPFFVRGTNIARELESSGVQWIIEKVRVNVNAEPIEVFTFDNIL